MISGPGRGLNPGPRTVNTLEHAGLNTRSANHTARPPGRLLRRWVAGGSKYVAEPGHANLGCTTETPQSDMVCTEACTPKFYELKVPPDSGQVELFECQNGRLHG